MGLFDGKVVIVTGAGGGIGRAHALAFAKEGAAVVVNDLGGARDGQGQGGTRMADAVVQEIQALGGKAAANYDSVASFDGARNLVKTAIDAFGKVDVLVNNAGILRDKSMLKMDEAMFDLVVDVHLKGTWNCTRHAAEAMVAAGKGGRIINTTSIAGLTGNFGQSNYGPAKAGIWGLTLTAAIELKKHRITVNAIAPMAKTRMTEDISLIPDEMTPEQISPVVLWLATEGAQEVSGRTFGIHPPRVFEYKMQMTEGAERAGGLWTPAELEKALPEIERLAGGGVSAGSMAAALGASTNAPGAASAPSGTSSSTGTGTAKGPGLLLEEIQRGVDELRRTLGVLGVTKAAPAPAAAPAAGGPPSQAAIVDALVKAAPRYFQKERAGAARSVFHMHITGAKGYTIEIANGACTVHEGHVGAATCNVKVDAETYVGMAQGKVNPQKAFMEKKLSADNLGEAMKYATIFRQPKPEEIQALIASAGGALAPAASPAAAGAGAGAGAAGAGTQKDLVDQIFTRMPEAFVPAKAAGWKAAILWKVAGAGDYTVHVEGGACRTTQGAPEGKPTSTVKLAAETMIGMVTGKVNPQKAFMEGKITADNLADMMKFGSAFDLKKGAEEAAKAAAAAGGAQAGVATASGALPAPSGAGAPARPDATRRIAAPAAGAGLNRDYIGRSFSGGALFANPDHMKLFAAATSDANPHHTGAALPWIAPPLFPVRLFKECLIRPVTDPGLNADLLRLVHGEQDMRFHRPLRPWDLVTTRAVIDSIEDKSSGQLMKILIKGFVEGVLAVEAVAGIFIRGGKKTEKKEEAAAEAPRPAPAFTHQVTVDMDQATRYAEASLDDNPIHLDAEVAKMGGLPGVILHGLCTMAFTSRAFVEQACGGDSRRLARLSVRFSKPVLPGDTLTTTAWPLGDEGGVKRFGFETANQAGALVITNGTAEVRA